MAKKQEKDWSPPDFRKGSPEYNARIEEMEEEYECSIRVAAYTADLKDYYQAHTTMPGSTRQIWAAGETVDKALRGLRVKLQSVKELGATQW